MAALNSPIPVTYVPIDELDELRKRLQTAIQLEFSTIPPT